MSKTTGTKAQRRQIIAESTLKFIKCVVLYNFKRITSKVSSVHFLCILTSPLISQVIILPSVQMEVENGSYGMPPQPVSGGGDAAGAIELLKASSSNGTSTAGTQPCTCAEGGLRCNTAAAAIPNVRLQLETWSPRKTVILVAIVVSFAVWAVVFGVCLNLLNL